MPAELTPQLVGKVVGRALEDAAFVFTEAAGDAGPFQGPVVEARMRFCGPDGSAPGEMRLAANPEVAAMLAANLLGEEPGSAEAGGRGPDAISELLNICCGVLARDLFGPEAVCSLGVPQVSQRPAEEYAPEFESVGCRVSLVTEEGGRLDACVAAGVPERV